MTREEAIALNKTMLAKAEERKKSLPIVKDNSWPQLSFHLWHGNKCAICNEPIREGDLYLPFIPAGYRTKVQNKTATYIHTTHLDNREWKEWFHQMVKAKRGHWVEGSL